MSKTSNVGDLMARLQQKIEQDRIEIEAVTQSELKKPRRQLEAERERRVVYHRARYQGAHPVDERGAVGVHAPPLAISPDGRTVAFTALDLDNEQNLYIRGPDAKVEKLPGTKNAEAPFEISNEFL